MEQIIIKHTDGSETPLFSRKSVSGISKATQKTALLSDDVVTLTVSSAVPLPVTIGDRIEVYGRPYKANQLPEPSKNGLRKFEYDITFEGLQYDLIDAQYKLPPEAYGDTYYSDLYGYLRVLVWNANRVQPNKWRLGNCPAEGTTAYKNINTSSRNCLQVLQDVCSEWNVEFEIVPGTGYNTINIKEKAGITHPFTLQYGRGKGLYTLKRTNVNNSGITTRLFVYGGQDNLGQNYGYTRLCLPETNRLTSYLEDPTAKTRYGIKENEKIYDIKPERVGKVTAVGTDEITFSDTTTGANAMFDLNAKKADGSTLYLLGDTHAKIKFQTGQLAGYEFDVHKYDHATRTFILNRFTDENGMVFPSATSGAFQIAVNDEYIITDIQLPQSYITAAENRLLEKANKDFPAMTQPQVSYKLNISEDFFTKMFGTATETEVLHVGDYIKVEDEDLGVNKAIRIVRIERNLLKRHSYDITLSDKVTKSTTVRVLNEIDDINEVININKLADPAKARRRWMATQELLSMVFDPEGDYYTEKIKPLSIETQMLSVGAKSTQFALQNITFQPNYNKDPNALYISNGLLVHYAIEETIRTWVLTNATYTNLSTNTAYFIYARCSTTGANGQIILSQQAIKVEQAAGYYHFLIGVLNSVVTDAGGKNPGRLVSLTYGSSTINGRFLRTGRIESSGGGKCYFDLDNDEIGGVIRFVGTDGNYHDVKDVQEKTNDLSDYVNTTLPDLLTGIQGQIDGKIETWYQVSDPSIAWTTDIERAKHVGDLWYNTDTKESKRYNSSYAWEKLEDSDAVAALEAASNAQDTADGKRTVFTSTPYPPYSVGDLWVQGGNGDILCCNKARKEGEAFNSADWVKASKYTGDENLNAFIETYNATISDIYNQLDGVIETWFNSGVPTLTNEPAKDWTTTTDREKHLGDIYYNNDTGQGYRFSKEGTTYKWIEITDSALATALAAAAQAQDTADGKRRVFVNTPYTPYDEGDLWASGTFLKVCKVGVHRTSGPYTASDWMNATDYTGDESLWDFIDGLFEDTVSDIYNQLDGKLESWYSSTDPSLNWKTTAEKAKHVGDQWYNTTAKTLWRYIQVSTKPTYGWSKIENAEAIAAAEAASKAQDTADGKRRVFVTTPYPPYDVGDLWTDGADLFRCNNPKAEGQTYARSDWGLATKYTDDTALWDFINNDFADMVEGFTDQIDGKIESWFQTTDPSTAWTTEAEKRKHVGDMWYNSTAKTLKRYHEATYMIIDPSTGKMSAVFNWQTIEDQTAIDAYEAASNAQDTADRKRQVFVAQPYGPYDEGDLWLRSWTDTSGVARKDLYRCVTARASGFNINDWAVATFYDNTQVTIDSGIVTAGTVQLANGNSQSIVAGVTGGENEAADEKEERKVRIWAGASKENRFTAPFRVLQDGSFVASKGTITGTINANSGTIGGFEIGQGRIGASATNGGTTGTGLALYNDFVRFANSYCWAMIGTNVLPASTAMVGVGRFVNSTPNSYGTNYGLLINVSGGMINLAIKTQGAIVSDTYMESYGILKVTPSANTCHIPGDLSNPTVFRVLANFIYSNAGVGFPTRQSICEMLGISNSTPFAVRFIMTASATSTQTGYITGRNTFVTGKNSSGATTYPMNNDSYPWRLDNNAGQQTGKANMSKGDTCEYLLVWDGSTYNAYCLRFST